METTVEKTADSSGDSTADYKGEDWVEGTGFTIPRGGFLGPPIYVKVDKTAEKPTLIYLEGIKLVKSTSCRACDDGCTIC